MPFKWKSKGRKKYSPEELKNAVLEVVNENKAIRTTSKKYDIDKMTLMRYARKYKEDENITFSPNFVTSQIFSPEEEILLMEYLLTSADLHYGLTPKQTRQFTYQFAQQNDKKFPKNWKTNESASYDWQRGFMDRHPQLSLRAPEATSLSRATAFNRHNVQLFYRNLRTVLEREQFGPEAIYNLDETGVTTAHKPQKIIARKVQKQISKTTSAERGILVTVCCAINALGNSVPPFFIFPRVRVQDYMTKGAPPGSAAVTHDSGWMTADNFQKYLDHFIKYVKCSNQNKCLLVLDNHESHISPAVLNTCKMNGIVLLTLPPHTSHRLQPLDVSVFGPFKQYYNEQADAWMVRYPGQTISLKIIPELVGLAYTRAFVPSNITKGFSKTGICPFNPHLFQEMDFAGAEVTNRPFEAEQQGVEVELVPLGDAVEPSPSTSHQSQDLSAAETETSFKMPGTGKGETSGLIKSPQEVRPYPKALPRKKIGGRKPGKTRILTDTPEKEEIQEEHRLREEKKKKRVKTQQVKRKIVSENKNVRNIKSQNTVEDECQPKRKVILNRNVKNKTKSVVSDADHEDEIDDEPFQSDDEDDVPCIYCNTLYSMSVAGEHWIQCQKCHKWCHADCAGVCNRTKMFTCELCCN